MSKVRAEQYTNRAGSGAPEIPYGVTVPSGASIDGAGGLNLTGIATAGTFKGDLSGNVTGVAATFTGPVTIGGTLTYEDVTNIDAVGVITARDGVKITGGNLNVGTAITAYGSIGVVSATSYRGDGSQLTGIEAAPSVQLVASGSINADESIILTSDGKVKAITNVTQAIGDAVTADSRTSMNRTACAYSPTSNKVVVVSRASNTGYATVGTVSGTTITFGTAVQFSTIVHDDAYSALDICWGDSSNDYFLITWRASNTDYLEGAIVTGISGTVPSFHTMRIAATNSGFPTAAWSTAKSRWVVMYQGLASNKGFARSVAWTGSSTGIGGEYSPVGGLISKIDLCYDSNADRFVALFRYSADSNKLTSIVVKINANQSLGWGSVQTVMDPTVAESPGIVYDPDAQNVIGVYSNDSLSNTLYTIVGKVNANTDQVTWQDHTNLGVTANSISISECVRIPIIYDANSGKFMIFYTATTNYIHMVLAQYNSAGTGLQLMSNTVIQSGGSNFLAQWPGACMDTTTKRAVLSYSPSNGQGAKVQIIRPPSTDLTTENFIGFSKEAYTDGQTATVKVVGNITTQSGLTPAQKYYVQNDGSLATTSEEPIVTAGRALNSTSLLIQPA